MVPPPVLVMMMCTLLMAGCTKKDDAPPAATPAPSAGGHEHHPPHGGTAIVLGNEAYHLELVREGKRLIGYVLDGEMENFVRVKAPAFQIVAQIGRQPVALTFRAIANQATGESVGDTSQFEAEADWVAANPSFGATLTSLEIRGTKFGAVAFNFPRGNEP